MKQASCSFTKALVEYLVDSMLWPTHRICMFIFIFSVMKLLKDLLYLVYLNIKYVQSCR